MLYCTFCFATTSIATITWDSNTYISGTVTQDLVIVDGTQNVLREDTDIIADNTKINITIKGNAHIGAENGESLNLHAIHGGRIHILFDDNAYLTLRDDIRLRISRNTEIHLGHNGVIHAMNSARIYHM